MRREKWYPVRDRLIYRGPSFRKEAGMKKLLSFVILALAMIAFTIGGCKKKAESERPSVEQPSKTEEYPSAEQAPDFTLKDLDDKPFSLSDVKGKVVILDFWATWCPPCVAELPHFKSLYEQYKEKGLEIIGIALDQGGAKVVKPFVEDNKIKYPILIHSGNVTEDYGGIRGIPTTFIIDRQGQIVEKFVGYRDEETFESAIKKLF